VEVEAKCPAAITRSSAEDEVELNVDKLTAGLLQELNKFVDGVKAGGKKKGGSSTAASAGGSGAGSGSNKKAKTG